MHVIDVLTSPWAIHPDKLLEIRSIYDSHTCGDKADLEAIEARIGRELNSSHQDYEISSGVAVIPINGVMGKKMNMFSAISGGASTQLIERDIKIAIEDPAVKSILLHIDSPGGTVDGTQQLSEVIKQASSIKPVMSFVDGNMASAAYWVGSASDEIVASSRTDQIGSIGVVATHKDLSKAEEKAGIKITEISAGKYKRIASTHEPLTKEGRSEIQSQVDQIYTIFVDAVAENRGVPVDTVLEDMADGRVFLSKQAKRRGMIDHIANLETTILKMSTGVWPMKTNTKTEKTDENAANTAVGEPQPASQSIETQKDQITVEVFREKHPDIVAAFMNEGANAERERIQGCEASLLPGHEAIVDKMKFDGESTGSDVAVAIVAEEKKIRSGQLNDFTSNAPKVVPAAAPPEDESFEAAEDNLPLDEKAKAEWEKSADLQKEFSSLSAYQAFKKVEAQSNLKH